MPTLLARQALTADGWRQDVLIDIDESGRISSIRSNTPAPKESQRVGVLLPAPANLHSHAFQRAMAGLAERRGHAADSFWTWRELMYRFVGLLTPDDVQTIAALVQMETLEAGYASLGEFHYLHHQPNGEAYASRGELSHRIVEAAALTGIGLTHLPVFYSQGGLDGRALEGGQKRFGSGLDGFRALFADIETGLASLPSDSRLGVAPHSLRAVPATDLEALASLVPDGPVHIHVAEQTAEVDQMLAATGKRPVQWLLDRMMIDHRWCLIHATHMEAAEIEALAQCGAVVGLCPITEANLGDGIFEGPAFLRAGGRIGIGTDSNIRIALASELQQLEYSQRFRDQRRVVMATEQKSTGRNLFDAVCAGGAQALSRDAGSLEAGKLADLVALDDEALVLAGLESDALLDAWIFAADDRLVTDVWSAGRHVVTEGRHRHHDDILAEARRVMMKLRSAL